MRRRRNQTSLKKYIWIALGLGLIFLCFYVPSTAIKQVEKNIPAKEIN